MGIEGVDTRFQVGIVFQILFFPILVTNSEGATNNHLIERLPLISELPAKQSEVDQIGDAPQTDEQQ